LVEVRSGIETSCPRSFLFRMAMHALLVFGFAVLVDARLSVHRHVKSTGDLQTQRIEEDGSIDSSEEATTDSLNTFLAMVGQPVEAAPHHDADESLDSMFAKGPSAPSPEEEPHVSDLKEDSVEKKKPHGTKEDVEDTTPTLDQLFTNTKNDRKKPLDFNRRGESNHEDGGAFDQKVTKVKEDVHSHESAVEHAEVSDHENPKESKDEDLTNKRHKKAKVNQMSLRGRADYWREHQEAENLVSYDQHVRLRIAKPITWFHVPKCGTSFANTLFHHKEICPKFPEKAMISRVKTGIPGPMLKMISSSPGMYGVDIGKFTANNSLEEYCGHSIDTHLQGLGHNGVGMAWNDVAGHSMIFLRQPEQRIISAYRHGRHGCASCDKDTTLAQYAPLAAGCVTRMLNREGDDACVNDSPPTLVEVAQALHRLRTGFIFIGITEQWDLSICLFHAKYGGKCNAYETLNTRPGRSLDKAHPSYYDTDELNGFVDMFDRQLYMEAVASFERDVEQFGLSHEYCQKVCQ